MGGLEVVMCLEIHFFLVIVIVYIFMGLVLQVVSSFMPSSSKISKKSQDLFKNFSLLKSLGMKRLKTTMILSHLLKLTKLLVVKIIAKYAALKIMRSIFSLVRTCTLLRCPPETMICTYFFCKPPPPSPPNS